MKYLLWLLPLALAATAPAAEPSTQTREATMTTTAYEQMHFNTITGQPDSLAAYKGQVVLIVNVASKCGFTPQYAGLEALYLAKKDKGFVILGFPANNFKSQEPGTDQEIQNFCSTTYGVTFPMMSKVSVKGDDKHPLFKYLTEQSNMPGEIEWNFTKFLIDRDGKLVARYKSKTTPEDTELVAKIDELLGKK